MRAAQRGSHHSSHHFYFVWKIASIVVVAAILFLLNQDGTGTTVPDGNSIDIPNVNVGSSLRVSGRKAAAGLEVLDVNVVDDEKHLDEKLKREVSSEDVDSDGDDNASVAAIITISDATDSFPASKVHDMDVQDELVGTSSDVDAYPPKTVNVHVDSDEGSIPTTNSLTYPHMPHTNVVPRQLSSISSQIGSFAPLNCNVDLETAPCNNTVSSLDLSTKVTIPCGQCYVWDLEGDVTLKGLNIEGKLYFPPDHASVTITTPYIYVQGALVIRSNAPVIDPAHVGVTFQLITKYSSGLPIEYLFRATEHPNRNVCQAFENKKCVVGRMPFLIAGGTVDIQAFPSSSSSSSSSSSTCKTWTTIQDVHYATPIKDSTDFVSYATLPDSCPSSGLTFYNTSFDQDVDHSSSSLWDCRRGSYDDISNGALTCSNRKRTFQGPYVDMTRLLPLDCLVPDQEYLFTARMKLDSNVEGMEGTLTPCGTSGTNCPQLRSWFGDQEDTIATVSKGSVGTYGEWFDFTGVMTFTESQLSEENSHWSVFSMNNVEEGTDISLDYFDIRLPSLSSYHDEVDPCQELIMNGDAEGNGFNPYPMYTWYSTERLQVLKEGNGDANEDENHFFRVSNRKEYFSSIKQDLNPVCMDVGVRYHASIDIRIHANAPQPSSLRIKVSRDDASTIYRTLLSCPPQSIHDDWVTCSGHFTVDKKTSTGYKVELYHQVDNTRDGDEFDVDYDNWSITYDRGYVQELVVNPDDASCWGVGSEIHITSSTFYNSDGKQGNGYTGLISGVRTEGGSTTIELEESPFDPIATEADSVDFAAEVALLSRNVKVQGEEVDDSSIGGYMTILHTQAQAQIIDGVEFRRMGQLGAVDRFPIHSLYNGNLIGSQIARNSLVHSFHRGVVIEGTSNLTLSQNVGVSNKGHFFWCGNQCTANDFTENLVSQTEDISGDLALPDEHDYDANAFYSKVPSNNYLRNVAAGNGHSGFVFRSGSESMGEDGTAIDSGLNLRKIPLGMFEGNVAHSNKNHGFDYDYYEKYSVDANRYIIEGFRSFKNLNSGLNIYRAWRPTINNSIFAENKHSIYARWSDDIQILNTRVLGMTNMTSSITQPPHYSKLCKWSSTTDSIHGFKSPSDIYKWEANLQKGVKMENVVFSGFDDNECSKAFPIGFQKDDVRDKHWDYLTSFEGVSFEGDREGYLIDACSLYEYDESTLSGELVDGVRDIIVTDVDGSSHPSMASFGTGSFVSNTIQMTAFANGTCTQYPSMCMAYCEDTCLRTVRFNIDQYFTDSWTMNVRDDQGKEIFIGSKYQFDDDPSEFTEEWNSRLFTASLPDGSYDIKFLDSNGEEAWPRFVEETWEESPACIGHANPANVSLIEPPRDCDELVLNGDIESGMDYWLERGGSLELYPHGGINGSMALSNKRRSKSYHGQWTNLDTRCFHTNEEKYFEVTAYIRREDEDSGPRHVCDPNSGDLREKCGKIQLRWYSHVDPTAKVDTQYHSIDVAKSTVEYELVDDFTMLHGTFKIDSEIASAERVALLFTDVHSDYITIIDDVSVTPLETNIGCNGDLIRNGNFDDGTSRFWDDSSSSKNIVMSSGSYAIRNYDRSSSSDDIRQYFYYDCLLGMSGHRYAVKAKFKLEKAGEEYLCDMQVKSGDTLCADVYIYSTTLGYLAKPAQTIATANGDEWNQMSGIYTMLPAHAESSDLYMRLRNPAAGINVIYDEIKMTHIPLNCQNLVMNPSFEDGTASFWLRDDTDDSNAVIMSPGADNSSYALLFEHTGNKYDPLYQKLDPRCLVEDTTFDIRVKFQLFNKTDPTTAVSCDPSITSNSAAERCPVVRIRGTGCNEPETLSYTFRNDQAFFEWNNETFNEFFSELPVDMNLASCDEVMIQLGYYLESTKLLAIDDVTITAQTTTSPTVHPTASPTATEIRQPTNPPTFITDSPTVSSSTSCQLTANSSPVELSSGQNFILSAPANILCTLTKVVLDVNNNTVTQMIPVARSYDENSWELSGGAFATSLSYGDDFVCHTNGCQFSLPSLESNEAYHLTSYSHSRTEKDEIARFLESSTFGPRKLEIESFSNEYTGEHKFSEWISDQMEIDLTSHREYFRKRSNARLNSPMPAGISDHPCEPYSRWRKFSFVNIDYSEEQSLRRPFRIRASGEDFVISSYGHDLTVADIRIPNSDYAEYVFNETFDYYVCSSRTRMSVDGALYLKLEDDACARFYNPAVNFTSNEHLIPPENILTFSDWSELEPLDGDVNDAEEFFLPNGYNGAECDSIPTTSFADGPFIFASLPDSTWAVFDPHLNLNLNTANNPKDDGGIDVVIKSGGASYCMNVPRTFVNEDQCVLSHSDFACGSSAAGNEIEFILNETNIVDLQVKSGKFVYGMQGLPTDDLQHPCTNGLRSRWLIKSSEATCTETLLYSETQSALRELLSTSDDDNPVIRDVYFSEAIFSCNSLDYEVEIEIEVDGVCFKRVHDEHLSVYDLTYWTAEDTHPGNAYAAENDRRNPIKKWAEDELWYLTFPSDHPLGSGFDHDISRWNTNYQKFSYVGRFGDDIRLRDLPVQLKTDEVIQHFGAGSDISGAGVLVCGSFGEVDNDKSLGSIFDYKTGVDRYVNYNHGESRIFTWIMIALQSNDQLRQRVAWALSQILIVVKDQISQQRDQSEWFLAFYDIFTRNAFGNYRDILKEVSYSPLMAENLSYLQSKSSAYMWERYTIKADADENFAREIMQLFSIGTIQLNMDGTPKLDSSSGSNTILTYTNDDIMSFAKAWTGFDTQDRRGNVERSGTNQLDPMRIEAAWRDRYPKTDLYGGYIGDGYPLCVDNPSRMFLRKGAHFKYLGSSNIPQSMYEPSQFATDSTIQKLSLHSTSALREVLCNDHDGDGACDFESTVTLEGNLDCVGIECQVDTIRVVEVVPGIHYEYYPVPCVEQIIYNDARKISTRKSNGDVMCANPRLAVASEACCEIGSIEANRYALYDGERMAFESAEERCEASTTGTPLSLCNFDTVTSDGGANYKIDNFFWTSSPCKLQVKVNRDGQVAIVHEPSQSQSVQKVLHVNDQNENFFKVFWSGSYPTVSNSCSGVCQVLSEGSCLCDVSAQEKQAFLGTPTSRKALLSTLKIGALDPATYDDGTFSLNVNNETGITTYMKNNRFDRDTIFEVIDSNGRKKYLKNSIENVQLRGPSSLTGHSFRNAPHFMSMVPNEETSRDAAYETDAVLDHYFYHDNVAPFISVRLIQRLAGTSNPSLRYVETVATAFKTGVYEDGPNSFGNGEYGDLKATIAAILLDREARSTILDADATHGQLREPLLKVVGFMRSMEFVANRKYSPLILQDLEERIGQMAHEAPTVFSFFLPEFQPQGRISEGTLVSPESTVLSMPTVIGFMNGMFSMVKYGLGRCSEGFGRWSTPCNEGEYAESDGFFTFNATATHAQEGYAMEVVDELSTLLTAGRLGPAHRSYISSVVETSNSIEEAVRIAQELILISPEFHSTNIVKGTDVARDGFSLPTSTGKPYKAIIFFMLAGGCDSYQMLMPHTCTNNLATEYQEVRGEVATSILNMEEISATNQVCGKFGVHRKLTKVKQLYEENDLAFLANVGVMTQPVTKDNYNILTQTQLFAHNTMQLETKQIDPMEEKANSGILGRITDSLRRNGHNVASFSMDGFAQALAGMPGAEGQIIVDPKKGISTPKVSDSVLTHINNLQNYSLPDSGFFADAWSSTLIDSISASDIFGDLLNDNAPATNYTFPDTSLGRQLALVSRLMATHEDRGVDVDTFYVELGGFDTHADVEEILDDKFEVIDDALAAFTDEVKWLQLWNQTVMIQASDFARTLVPNSGDGTDHGWGGNYMLMGGNVKGGDIYGSYLEEMNIEGPHFLKRGRVIPTTPWDSVFNSIAMWAGVQDDDLDNVCPNRNKFSSLFSSTDLFHG